MSDFAEHHQGCPALPGYGHAPEPCTCGAMTTETDLLPLPEWTKRDDLGGLVPSEVRVEMCDYARANVAHAIATKDAEIDALRTRLEDTVRDSTNKIEALRAEVERLKSMTAVTMGVGSGDGNLFVHGDYDSIKAAQALVFRAERMEKALRLIESAKDRGFGIDYARGVAQSILAAHHQEDRKGKARAGGDGRTEQ